MFIYKVLELLDIGPKVHFVFNEYVKYGVFIATEDLNVNDMMFNSASVISNTFLKEIRPYIYPHVLTANHYYNNDNYK